MTTTAIATLLTVLHVAGIVGANIVLPYSCHDLDVMFVVDGSGSVSAENFDKVREWLKTSVVDIHQGLGARVQMGILEFSNKNNYEIPFRLGDCSTTECMTSKITKMKYLKGGTYTAHALNYTSEVEFPYSNRAESSQKLIILITDGKTSDADDLKAWSKKAKNITVFAVGVGNYNAEELKIVARVDENIFKDTDFMALPVIVAKMARDFCKDNDECELGAHNCSSAATCVNFPGNFSCECNDGYYTDSNGECLDIDECQTNVCPNKTCTNAFGSYQCGCEEGYLEEEHSCSDIDECELGVHSCSSTATCVNVPGKFSCECNDGYYRDSNGECSDIDECQTNVCPNKTCTNTLGAYKCSCEEGYFEEEQSCSVCSCEPKEGYETPVSTCPGNHLCEYGRTGGGGQTCVIPTTSAFGPLFNAIRDWNRRADMMNNASEIIEKVKEIDEKIRCAAVATAGSTQIEKKVPNIKVASLKFGTPSPPKDPVMNFSSSVIREISIERLNSGQAVYAEFSAPKKNVDMLLTQPEKTSALSTLRERLIFTGRSPIISVSVFGGANFTYRKDTNLIFEMDVTKDFSNISFESEIELDPSFWASYVSDVGYRCEHVDTAKAELSDSGCEVESYIIGSKVLCKCDHTTMFAAMLTYTRIEIPRNVKIVSYVIQTISVLFLIVTAIILLNVRPQVRGDRIMVQICLTLSLLLLHVFSLLHDLALKNERTCEILAVIIHFLLLASAMWMLMEGVTLVVKTNDNTLKYITEKNKKKFFIFRQTLSWGVPFVIVFISALVGFLHDNYMQKNPAYLEQTARHYLWDLEDARKYNFCWLSQTVLLWAVIVPIGIILFLNCVILVRMIFYVHKMSSEGSHFRPSYRASESKAEGNHTAKAFKAFVVLLPVLGISWILAFLTNVNDRHSTIVFLYVNAILNGLQGVILFIVYCVIGREVRKVVKLKYRRSQYMRESSRKSTHSKTSLKYGEKPKSEVKKSSVKTVSIALEPTRDDFDKHP